MRKESKRQIYDKLDRILKEEIDNFIIEKIKEAANNEPPEGFTFLSDRR